MSSQEIDFLSVEDLLEIASAVIGEVNVRDVGLLAAAAAHPRVTVFGDDAYPTFEDKAAGAAALLGAQPRPHRGEQAPRVVRHPHLLPAQRSGPTYSVDDAEDVMVKAASGQLDVAQIARWLARHLGSAS